jgi:hypothetical protein
VNQIKLSNSKKLNVDFIEENDSFIPLNIPEKKRYVESYSSGKSFNQQMETENAQSSVEFILELQNYKSSKVNISNDLSLKILNEIQENSKNSNFEDDETEIPLEFKQELTDYYIYINELLVHYWNPNLNSERKEKILIGIRKYYEKLTKLKDRFGHLQNILRPTFDSIEKVLGKDDEKISVPLEMSPIQFQLGKRTNEEFDNSNTPNKKIKKNLF